MATSAYNPSCRIASLILPSRYFERSTVKFTLTFGNWVANAWERGSSWLCSEMVLVSLFVTEDSLLMKIGEKSVPLQPGEGGLVIPSPPYTT